MVKSKSLVNHCYMHSFTLLKMYGFIVWLHITVVRYRTSIWCAWLFCFVYEWSLHDCIQLYQRLDTTWI